MQPNEADRMTITVEEAAAQLGIGRNLAYQLAARGELPGAIRLGHRIVVSKMTLERFLEGGSRSGTIRKVDI